MRLRAAVQKHGPERGRGQEGEQVGGQERGQVGKQERGAAACHPVPAT